MGVQMLSHMVCICYGLPSSFSKYELLPPHPGPTQHVCISILTILLGACWCFLMLLTRVSFCLVLWQPHAWSQGIAWKKSLQTKSAGSFKCGLFSSLLEMTCLQRLVWKSRVPQAIAFVRNRAVVHRSGHPKSQASDAVWLGHSLVWSFADNCRVLRYLLGTVLGAGTGNNIDS